MSATTLSPAPAPQATPAPPSPTPGHPWLASHCALARQPVQAALLLRSENGLKLAGCHPAGPAAPAWAASTAAAVVARRQRLLMQRAMEGGARHVLAHPLRAGGLVDGPLVGAVVLAAEHPFEDAALALLDASAAAFGVTPIASPNGPVSPTATPHPAPQVLELVHAVAEGRHLADAASLLATRVAATLRCDRVSLGLRRRDQTRLVGSSDGWEADTSAQSADVCSAMDEAMDSGESVVYPALPDRPNWLVAAHAHLSNRRETRALCTVVLVAQGQVLGALLAERRHADPFTPAELATLELLARSVAPLLGQRQQLELPWRERARQAASTWLAAHGRGRHRLVALVSVLSLGLLLGWPVEHEVSAPVKLEGSIQRIITSPADNYLQSVAVRPGDVVKEGQLLLEFAAEDLRVERQRLVAELAGADAGVGDAMARQDMSALALRSAKMAEDKAQLALLDQRLAKSRIAAPFDAVVIQGDLSNALGAPTKKGDALMTLAPLGDFHAVVEVDDSDIADIRVGQPGSMVLTALPSRTLKVQVKRITPLAAVAPGRSFFEVEVELMDAGQTALLPGMRGFAQLSTTRAPHGLVWARQAINKVRLAWWRWVA